MNGGRRHLERGGPRPNRAAAVAQFGVAALPLLALLFAALETAIVFTAGELLSVRF